MFFSLKKSQTLEVTGLKPEVVRSTRLWLLRLQLVGVVVTGPAPPQQRQDRLKRRRRKSLTAVDACMPQRHWYHLHFNK